MAVVTQALASRTSTDFARRALVLTTLFVAAAMLLVGVSAPQVEAKPRFPTDDAAYAIDGWRVSAESVEGRTGVLFVAREFQRADGTQARLNITTSPQAKLAYRAGADVPFLGNGYTVEPAPSGIVGSQANRNAQIARRGTEAWLQIATFGERRGVFGNGAIAWGLAVFDMVLGRPNDYYLARILVPYQPETAARAVELADTLFPRLAGFYAA
jgi:hypothetical protein